jgi:pilus assembly protein CpaB
VTRQRLLILFGAAWISAALLSWFLYRNTVLPHQETRTRILATARDLPIGTRIAKKDLKTMTVLTRDVPRGAVLVEKDALDRIALYPIAANTPLSAMSLSSVTGGEGISSTIDPGYRAVSVPITDASSVAGLVMPGSHVDVLFTRPGNLMEAVTTTILQNVRVLSIGRNVQGTAADPKAPKAVAATLIVTPEQAQKIELAKTEGRVSLSLRNPLDESADLDGTPIRGEVLDPQLRAKLERERLKNSGDLWEQVKKLPEAPKTPPPPPAPRAVVEVFRGDKHERQIFK